MKASRATYRVKQKGKGNKRTSESFKSTLFVLGIKIMKSILKLLKIGHEFRENQQGQGRMRDRQIDRKTEKPADRQTNCCDKWTDKQTDRQMNEERKQLSM